MQATPKILLVEDNEDHVLLFKRAVRTSGLEVELDHAPDGRAAVEYLERLGGRAAASQAHPPDLMLLDIKLPIMDGFEVLQWLCSNPHIGEKVQPILLTTSEAPEDQQKGRELRAQDYWIKPGSLIGYSELMEKVKQLLSRSRRRTVALEGKPPETRGVARLLSRAGLKDVLDNDPIKVDIENTYEVYALIWDMFRCEKCGRQEFDNAPQGQLAKEAWISAAAQAARAKGWHVGPWTAGGSMDCVAFCPACAGAVKS